MNRTFSGLFGFVVAAWRIDVGLKHEAAANAAVDERKFRLE